MSGNLKPIGTLNSKRVPINLPVETYDKIRAYRDNRFPGASLVYVVQRLLEKEINSNG